MNYLRKYGNNPYKTVLVHGGPGAAGSLGSFAEALGDSVGVIEPFQTKLTIDESVAELKEVIVSESNHPVILLGHSWGAWLSVITAAKFPDILSKLILISSGPFDEKYTYLIARRRIAKLNPMEKKEYDELAMMFNSTNTFITADAFKRLGDLAHKTDSFDVLPENNKPMDFLLPHTSDEIYQNIWPEASLLRRSGKLLKYAGNVSCPVIAIHGLDDPHPHEGVLEPWTKIRKDFKMYALQKCGHEPWKEKQAKDEFYRILKQEIVAIV